MNARHQASILLLLVLAMLAVRGASAQTSRPDTPDDGGDGVAERAYTDRLEALTPGDPISYLELGEEVLATARTDTDTRLARRLFTIAYEQTRLAGADAGTQASACIALADTTRFERDRRWLWSIVRLIEPRYAEPDWSRTVERVVSDEAAFRAAETLGLLRAGRGLRAREALRDERVREVFDWYAGLLTGTGPGDVLTELDKQADRWPCPECKNDRVVRTPEGGLRGPRVRCFTCRGNPGWELDDRGLLATLRFESRVLSGVQRSWGAQLAADLAEPLRDPDPAAVADAVGFDPDLNLFRGGRWVGGNSVEIEDERAGPADSTSGGTPGDG